VRPGALAFIAIHAADERDLPLFDLVSPFRDCFMQRIFALAKRTCKFLSARRCRFGDAASSQMLIDKTSAYRPHGSLRASCICFLLRRRATPCRGDLCALSSLICFRPKQPLFQLLHSIEKRGHIPCPAPPEVSFTARPETIIIPDVRRKLRPFARTPEGGAYTAKLARNPYDVMVVDDNTHTGGCDYCTWRNFGL
jgi:hypothetical protein